MRNVVLAAMMALAAPIAHAQSGAVHQGSVTLGAIVIPLPPGEWRVMGRAEETSWWRMVLVNEKDGRLVGLLTLSASRPIGTGWEWDVGRVWACQDGSNNLRPTIRNVANVTSGWDCVRFYPSNQRTRQTNAPAEQAFVAKRTAQPEWAPERTLTASFALGNRRGGVFATYSFDTVAFGVPGSREAETARLVRWAETAGPLVKRGFENGSTTPAPAF